MKVLNPTSGFPAWGSDKGLRIHRESAREGQWSLVLGLPEDWGKQRLQSWRAQTKFCTLRHRGEGQWPHGRRKQNYLLVLEVLPRPRGCRSAGAHCRNWKVPVGVNTLGIHHQPCDRAWGQTTTRERVQPHPSADNWIKALLSKALPSRKRKMNSLSHVCVWLFATPWTVAHQAPPSLEFSRQYYWSGLPFPSPGDLSGIKPRSLALQADPLQSKTWFFPITSPSHQEAYTSILASSIRGQTEEARRTTVQ